MPELLRTPFGLLLVQAIIIICAARVLGFAARKVGQPLVIAEIAAGILLGPSLLGWLAPELFRSLFPPSSMPALGVLSQVGLVLFMFLIGLELDPRLLRGRGRTSIVISAASLIVPFALAALLALQLHPRLAGPSVQFGTFTLFMGVAISVTAFPVLARILSERRMLRSRVGSLAIACAAVDDVIGWCLLAFIVSIMDAKGLGSALWTTLLTFIYILGMLLLVRPFLARLGARSRVSDGLPQNAVALTFVLLLLSSAVAKAIGLHALFGAFMLGAILPRESGFARAIAEKLEDVVLVFLVPLFFAYSGLKTQISLLDTTVEWSLCGLILLTACAGKLGGSFFAARLTGLSWRESGAIGVLMNTRGLVGLIVLNVGLEMGIISQTLFTMMVLMALVTTFLTTPLLHLVYPREEITADAAQPAEQPSLSPAPVGAGYSVLACLGNPASWSSLSLLAARIARGSAAEVRRVFALHLASPPERPSLYVEGPSEPPPLAPVLGSIQSLGVSASPLAFVSASPGNDICRLAEIKKPSFVLIGSYLPLLGQNTLGGVVREVLEGAPSHVGVFVDRGLPQIRRVLVPFRGSLHDRSALEIGRCLATGAGARVTVLEVIAEDGEARADVQGEVSLAFEGASAEVELRTVTSSDPADAVASEARLGYDLVVVGIGRRWGLVDPTSTFIPQLGLFAQRLIRDSETSLLIVRHFQEKETARVASAAGELGRAVEA